MQDWVWLIIVLVAIIVVWWLLTRAAQEEPEVHVEHEAHAEPARAAETAPVAAAADDLTLLEGIGPKINELLQQAGIRTFAQLAATDVERLREILDQANLRIADPATWPEQARLLAEGNQEAFEKLTAELKGGRRVS